MLENIHLENILFLDIETVPEAPEYSALDDRFQKLWDKKAERIRQADTDTPESLYGRAGIYAEFGRIICICAGTYRKNELRIKAFSGEDEFQLLSDFAAMLNSHFSRADHVLCAHNGKEFDFPYMARRMLIHGIQIPGILNTAGKKPWEVNHLDTMELWKFGDFKNYTSLELLAAIFKIPTPKDDIDGSQVSEVYWNQHDLPRIVSYCYKDVITVAQIVRRFRGEDLIPAESIVLLD